MPVQFSNATEVLVISKPGVELLWLRPPLPRHVILDKVDQTSTAACALRQVGLACGVEPFSGGPLGEVDSDTCLYP